MNNIVSLTNTTSAVYSQIVDLGETNDVEISVPYQQALAFLQTRQSVDPANAQWSISSTPTWNVNDDLDNGCIVVRVLTALTAPVATAPVSILVSVRGGPNMEFANPLNLPNEQLIYQVQSQEVDVSEEGQNALAMGSAPEMAPHALYRVNFGECIRSLRLLLHRANFVWTWRDATMTTGTGFTFIKFRFGKLPPHPGFDPNGIHTATAIVGVGTKAYNFVTSLPVHWILPAFVGYRGSGVWTFNGLSGNASPIQHIDVIRTPQAAMIMSEASSVLASGATRSAGAASMYNNLNSTPGGMALTHQQTNAGISVLCPNYNNYRFNSTAAGNTTVAPSTGSSAYDGSDYDCYTSNVVTVANVPNPTAMAIERYWHGGPDLNPVFFLNVPTRYYQASIPLPV